MGSSGSYWANVAVEVPLHQPSENSPESISDFLQAHPGIRISIDLPVSEDSILGTPCYDDSYVLQLDYKDYESWQTPNMSPEKLVALLDDYDEDHLTLTYIRPAVASDLLNVNLQLVDQFHMTIIIPIYVEGIAYEYGDIWYEKDNESSCPINLTPHHSNLLQLPGARLVLNAGGDHC